MIDQEGNVRIMDFGIARSLKEKGITGAGVMIGTPEYMSPEQAEARVVDQRSDIYSLGAIMYEMVTGKRAFRGDTHAGLIAAILESEPLPVSESQPLSPPALEWLLGRCLAKDRDLRWHSAHDLVLELGRVLDEREAMGVSLGAGGTDRGRLRPIPLMLAGLSHAARQGATRATIGAWRQNKAALSLYRRLGFQEKHRMHYLAHDLEKA